MEKAQQAPDFTWYQHSRTNERTNDEASKKKAGMKASVEGTHRIAWSSNDVYVAYSKNWHSTSRHSIVLIEQFVLTRTNPLCVLLASPIRLALAVSQSIGGKQERRKASDFPLKRHAWWKVEVEIKHDILESSSTFDKQYLPRNLRSIKDALNRKKYGRPGSRLWMNLSVEKKSAAFCAIPLLIPQRRKKKKEDESSRAMPHSAVRQ
jgi:hypothetical protein